MLGSDSPGPPMIITNGMGTKSATHAQSLHLSTELFLSLDTTSRCQDRRGLHAGKCSTKGPGSDGHELNFAPEKQLLYGPLSSQGHEGHLAKSPNRACTPVPRRGPHLPKHQMGPQANAQAHSWPLPHTNKLEPSLPRCSSPGPVGTCASPPAPVHFPGLITPATPDRSV